MSSWILFSISEALWKSLDWILQKVGWIKQYTWSTSSGFRYKALKNPRTDVRLLQLQPERKNGLLQFHLIPTTLTSAPPYIALSYEWGKQEAGQPILVDDADFIVQDNLSKFLERIYHRYREEVPLNIWVDAICINQSTVRSKNSEKNHQVRLMGEIYSRADVVLVWLKDVRDRDLYVIHSFLSWFRGEVNVDYLIKAASEHDLPMHDLLRSLGQSYLNEYLGRPKHEWTFDIAKVMSKRLERLYKSSYWRRLWIIQELALAQDFVLLCEMTQPELSDEDIHINRNELAAAYLFALGFAEHYRTQIHHHMRDDDIDNAWLRKSFLHGDKLLITPLSLNGFINVCTFIWEKRQTHQPLGSLIAGVHMHECTDLHDRIYGLLSLASDVTESHSFPIDYSLDYLDLLLETIAFCKSDNSLELGRWVAHALNLQPDYSKCAEDPKYKGQWEAQWVLRWARRPTVSVLRVVTIQLQQQKITSEGIVLRFNVKSKYANCISLVYEVKEERYELAKVESTGTLGVSGNKELMDMIFKFASEPRKCEDKTARSEDDQSDKAQQENTQDENIQDENVEAEDGRDEETQCCASEDVVAQDVDQGVDDRNADHHIEKRDSEDSQGNADARPGADANAHEVEVHNGKREDAEDRDVATVAHDTSVHGINASNEEAQGDGPSVKQVESKDIQAGDNKLDGGPIWLLDVTLLDLMCLLTIEMMYEIGHAIEIPQNLRVKGNKK